MGLDRAAEAAHPRLADRGRAHRAGLDLPRGRSLQRTPDRRTIPVSSGGGPPAGADRSAGVATDPSQPRAGPDRQRLRAQDPVRDQHQRGRRRPADRDVQRGRLRIGPAARLLPGPCRPRLHRRLRGVCHYRQSAQLRPLGAVACPRRRLAAGRLPADSPGVRRAARRPRRPAGARSRPGPAIGRRPGALADRARVARRGRPRRERDRDPGWSRADDSGEPAAGRRPGAGADRDDSAADAGGAEPAARRPPQERWDHPGPQPAARDRAAVGARVRTALGRIGGGSRRHR